MKSTNLLVGQVSMLYHLNCMFFTHFIKQGIGFWKPCILLSASILNRSSVNKHFICYAYLLCLVVSAGARNMFQIVLYVKCYA